MRILSIVCAVMLMAAGFSGAASSAAYEGAAGLSPLRGLEASAAPVKTADNVRVADSFGAGLAIGFIGGLVTGHVKHRHYGHRHRGYRYRSCRHWHRRCGRNWGYHNSSYYGCMRYHGCR